jgi:hypothetical protein
VGRLGQHYTIQCQPHNPTMFKTGCPLCQPSAPAHANSRPPDSSNILTLRAMPDVCEHLPSPGRPTLFNSSPYKKTYTSHARTTRMPSQPPVATRWKYAPSSSQVPSRSCKVTPTILVCTHQPLTSPLPLSSQHNSFLNLNPNTRSQPSRPKILCTQSYDQPGPSRPKFLCTQSYDQPFRPKFLSTQFIFQPRPKPKVPTRPTQNTAILLMFVEVFAFVAKDGQLSG